MAFGRLSERARRNKSKQFHCRSILSPSLFIFLFKNYRDETRCKKKKRLSISPLNPFKRVLEENWKRKTRRVRYSYGQIGIRVKLTTGHTNIPPSVYYFKEGGDEMHSLRCSGRGLGVSIDTSMPAHRCLFHSKYDNESRWNDGHRAGYHA